MGQSMMKVMAAMMEVTAVSAEAQVCKTVNEGLGCRWRF
jgi:hypothetical protein